MLSPRVLFILKHRTFESSYGSYSNGECEPGSYENSGVPNNGPACYVKDLESGLTRSVEFVVQMLGKMGIECKAVQVVDNNSIDREVHRYRPTHVIIEALWVVPEKFAVLHRLHPNVQWIVRIHSEIPFLANEGIAVNWITRIAGFPNVVVAANSRHTERDIYEILHAVYPEWNDHKLRRKAAYLPNYYMLEEMQKWVLASNDDPQPSSCAVVLNDVNGVVMNVGCFGSIRPLKNNLIQAVAALRYAEAEGATLHFHVNGERTEGGGHNVLKNLRSLFAKTSHMLVEHPWLEHGKFLQLLSWMDVSLCVSFSETFCIVAADSIAAGVPTVVSKEVQWASCFAMADPTDSFSIEKAIRRALYPGLHCIGAYLNKRALRLHNQRAFKAWAEYFASYEEQPVETPFRLTY